MHFLPEKIFTCVVLITRLMGSLFIGAALRTSTALWTPFLSDLHGAGSTSLGQEQSCKCIVITDSRCPASKEAIGTEGGEGIIAQYRGQLSMVRFSHCAWCLKGDRGTAIQTAECWREKRARVDSAQPKLSRGPCHNSHDSFTLLRKKQGWRRVKNGLM